MRMLNAVENIDQSVRRAVPQCHRPDATNPEASPEYKAKVGMFSRVMSQRSRCN